MIRLTLCIMFLSYFLGSCINPGLNYPYAENNTTTDSLFGEVIKDDYRWLEINNPLNEKRTQWLQAQSVLTNSFLDESNPIIMDRISSLSELAYYTPIVINGDEFYYFKTNIYNNQTCLFSFQLKTKEIKLKANLGKTFRTINRLKVSMTADGSRVVVLNQQNDFQNNLLIFDLNEHTKKPVSIPNVKSFRPVLYKHLLIYTEDGFNSNAFGNRVYAYDLQTSKKVLLYESDIVNLFDPMDLSLNEEKGLLYISNYESTDKFQVYELDLNKDYSYKPVLEMQRSDQLYYRMAGNEHDYLFLIVHNDKNKGQVYAYNQRSKGLKPLLAGDGYILSDFNQVRDHLIISYNDSDRNRVSLVNTKDFTAQDIQVSKDGIRTFVNNKKDTTLLYIEETLFKPQVLMQSSVIEPSQRIVLTRPAYLPFDYSDFKSEYVTFKSRADKEISIVISFKKNMNLDGQNPTILFSYPNSNPEETNSFFFSRVLYMEQGYVYVQRSHKDYANSFDLTEIQSDIKEIVDYLIRQKYTSKNKLCLSGFEYGSTAIMNVINENPGICRSAVLTDGIFDMLHHAAKDRLNNNNQQYYCYESAEQLKAVRQLSPYHHIKPKAAYPAIIISPGKDNVSIDPSHSYKLAAKLQMRTAGDNPVLLYKQRRVDRDDDLIVFDYKDKIYHTLLFVSKVMDIKLDKKNFSVNKFD